MNKAKRDRLEKKGWKLDSADVFLELSPDEVAFVKMKLALSRMLKEKRSRKRLSQTQLAELIHSSQSRVAKMESGDPAVSMDLLVKTLLALGASTKEVAHSLAT